MGNQPSVMQIPSATEALVRLREGNELFAAQGTERLARRIRPAVGEQSPFAVILGCADSRVAPEIVFDQGLGDLFVVRLAGNVADAAAIGSVEYATSVLGTQLVVVLGHTECGAVAAAFDQLTSDAPKLSPNLAAITDSVCPSVEPLLPELDRHGRDWVLARAGRDNVRANVDRLNSSPVLTKATAEGHVTIVGAEYSLDDGRVEFLSNSKSPG